MGWVFVREEDVGVISENNKMGRVSQHPNNLIVVCMFIQESCILSFPGSLKARAVASLTVLGGQERGQEFHFPHFFLKFWTSFLIFPQTLLIFFLILVHRVGESPTREGPGYATVEGLCLKDFLKVYCRSHQRDMVSHIYTHTPHQRQ